MQQISEVIPDLFENLMSKEYIDKMVDEMCLCGVGACFIYMLRKEYWLRHGMAYNDAEGLAYDEIRNTYHVSMRIADGVKVWSAQLEGCMAVIRDCFRVPASTCVGQRELACSCVDTQAPAGTISPKSEICGKDISPFIPQGKEDAAENKSPDAVDEILAYQDNHRMWLEQTCYGLEWGDLLQANLQWVLVYFRGHLYRNGDEQELHNVTKFKKHFFRFTRNTIAANEMLRALHYHLDSKDREIGVITQEATFRTWMQNDFPNLYQMAIPLTMVQCNVLIQTHGAERVKQAMIAANMSKRALYTADAFQLVSNLITSKTNNLKTS